MDQDVHILEDVRDRAFLLTGPRDALWYRPFAVGDALRVCAHCRSKLFAEDWNRGVCPICRGTRPLFFDRPNLLLATELVTGPDGVQIRRPLAPREQARAQDVAAPPPHIPPVRHYVRGWLRDNRRPLLCIALVAAAALALHLLL